MTESSSEYILRTSKEYSVYICSSRAIPKITDGLKDSQRKMLWLMRNRSDKIKTVSLSGLAISENLYLHGDQSASDAISMLAAPYCNNVPLLEGIGSFGTRTIPTGWGAPRYTYVKRAKSTQSLILHDLDIVPLKENYDGSTMEPEHFLPLIPVVLLNGISGIASGWSTEILPRSFKDLVDATLAVLAGKSYPQLIPTYQYLECGVSHLEENTWEFSGRVELIDASTIKVTELPPDLTLEKFKERLNAYEEEDKINSYIDRSTKLINITIKMPRGSVRDWTELQAVEFFKLKQKKTERIVVIDWNGTSIRQYENAERVVKDFVDWRLTWFNKRYQSRLADDLYDLKYWQAVKACFDAKLPSRLGSKQNRSEIEADVLKITSAIGIDSKQVDRIVSVPTYKWAKDSYADVETKIAELSIMIVKHNVLLADPKLIRDVYKQELLELKKIKL